MMAKRKAKKEVVPEPETVSESVVEPVESLSESGEKHCPACMMGQSLEEGEGTHILATVEHPVVLPEAFKEAEASVVVSESPQRPVKVKTRRLPKELKSASSYAEKRLPKAVQEKADLLIELQKREIEIQELTRVIQAIKGQVPVGVPMNSAPTYPFPSYQPTYNTPQTPPQANGVGPVPVLTPPKPMRAGGAGALDLSFLANE